MLIKDLLCRMAGVNVLRDCFVSESKVMTHIIIDSVIACIGFNFL